jgi:drug/metabolite transporter (DMT)-like permease
VSGSPPGAGDRAFLITHFAANSLTWGSSFLLIKLIGDALQPTVIASLRAVGAALALGLALVLIGKSIRPMGREARALSLVCTAFPIWIFMRLLACVGPTKASMTSYLVPTIAFILGVAILGEPISARHVVGGAIVLLSVAIVTGLIRRPFRRFA